MQGNTPGPNGFADTVTELESWLLCTKERMVVIALVARFEAHDLDDGTAQKLHEVGLERLRAQTAHEAHVAATGLGRYLVRFTGNTEATAHVVGLHLATVLAKPVDLRGRRLIPSVRAGVTLVTDRTFGAAAIAAEVESALQRALTRDGSRVEVAE
jgi:hypothetical protein